MTGKDKPIIFSAPMVRANVSRGAGKLHLARRVDRMAEAGGTTMTPPPPVKLLAR